MANEDSSLPDYLNQSDIDKLMSEALDGAKTTVFRADGTKIEAKENTVETFDFRTPIFLAEAELRRLRMVHQDYIRTLSARFSAFLRADFNMKMSKLTTLPYAKFAETIQNPSHLTLFKVDPLPGIAVIEIHPRLAMSMTNRMLGGRGGSGEADRFLTEIEIALLEDILQIIVQEWMMQWRDEELLKPTLLGHETNARFLQICAKDTVMLVLGMEAQAGESLEQIQLGVPYYMIEPLMKKMQAARQKESEQEAISKRLQWRGSYDGISVPVIADWQVPGLSLSDVAQLRVGDVIQMPKTAIDHTRIRLAENARFLARAGNEDGHVAVQITQRIKTP